VGAVLENVTTGNLIDGHARIEEVLSKDEETPIPYLKVELSESTSTGPWGFAGVNPILVYGVDPYLKAGMGRRHDHIVVAADREGVDGHPCPKPIKVWAWLVERLTTKQGATVYDPFAGSGSTLVAAENLKRKCYAMEISPAYCAVTLERMATAFPHLKIEKAEQARAA
jgi:DNA modification methylase